VKDAWTRRARWDKSWEKLVGRDDWAIIRMGNAKKQTANTSMHEISAL